ncbi:DUF2199 domain-containing protein [Roseibium sp.]|uniref:DUF2199 domain-containing protein n=1 Tax=Roseibium sp. TaxID=1936156 RepID=UPI003A971E3F
MIVAIDPEKRKFLFKCACCGEIHEGGPSFSTDKPPAFFGIPEDERNDRIKINSGLCVIDGEEFWIRATLSVPILGTDDTFLWGVWVTQSKESFDRYVETYETDQSGDGSFGWLMVSLPGYTRDDQPMISLPVDVFWGPERPEVRIHDDQDHPLAIDQREGISWERAVELVTFVLHPN